MSRLRNLLMVCLLLVVSQQGYTAVGTSGTTAGAQIFNGTDTGTAGLSDVAGDLVIKFAQEGYIGTTTNTATQTATATIG